MLSHPSAGSFAKGKWQPRGRRIQNKDEAHERHCLASKEAPLAGALLQAEHCLSPLPVSGDVKLMLKIKCCRFASHEGIKTLVASFQLGETTAFMALLWFLDLRHLCCPHVEVDVALWSQDPE